MTNTIIDKHGRHREALPGEVLQDGERLIVQLQMMDHAPFAVHDGMGNAAGHKPGFAFAEGTAARMADAALDAARREYDATLTSAWHGPASKHAAAVANADRDVYADYQACLTSAWRSP